MLRNRSRTSSAAARQVSSGGNNNSNEMTDGRKGEEMLKICAENLPACDRRLVYSYFKTIEHKIRDMLDSVRGEIQRAQALKAHPHPMFYQRTIVSSCDNNGGDDDAQQPRLRSVAYERAVDSIDAMRPDDYAANLGLLAQLVDSSFQYQVAVKNLNDLVFFVEASLQDFQEAHAEYDRQLARVERNDEDARASIGQTQNKLQEIKNTLQQFVNQVPSQLAIVRSENDTVQNLYDRADDSIPVHRFLVSRYAKTLIAQSDSVSLQKVYDFLSHQWVALLTR